MNQIQEFLNSYGDGIAGQIAQRSTVEALDDDGTVRLGFPTNHRHLLIDLACDKLRDALSSHLGRQCQLLITLRS